MRRRASIRVRLTVAVTVITALFLALATASFSDRAASSVLEAVTADADLAISGGGLAGESFAELAAEIYRELDRQGLLEQLWTLLGRPLPGPEVTIVLRDETIDVAVVGDPGDEELVLSATAVVQLGDALLAGVAPDDVVIVDAAGLAAGVAGAASGATRPGVAVAEPIPGVIGQATIGQDAIGQDVIGQDVIGQSVVAVPVGNVRGSVADIEQDLWLASAVLTLLAAGATWVLTGRALRPVEAITRQVEVIGAAGSGERVPVPPQQDEVGHLARTVNTMLDRLDHAAATQRRFVADASHELRSPLAVIRTEAEVALSHPDAADWPATTRSVLEETHRLEALVSDLLLLAQRDDGRPIAGRGAVTDVDEVVLAEAARSRRVPVQTTGVLAGRVAAHPAEVARVVRHLLDNAARHATTAVEVWVRPVDGAVVMVVDDDGAGIAEADRARVFERFARLEESRSRDAGGAGLGLAVVAAIVEDLGGSVTVGSAPSGGARFVVRLPALA